MSIKSNTHHQMLLSESFQDLQDDFEELEYLTHSILSYLKQFTLNLSRIQKHLRQKTYQLTKDYIKHFFSKFEKYQKDISVSKNQINNRKHSVELFNKLQEAKNKYFDLIRTQTGIVGSLITAADWQSPSFAHSKYSYAGKQTGKIRGTINDYKRDVHLDEKEYEKIYLAEYIDTPLKFLIHVFMVNSGMAAFTTIFNFLLAEKKIIGKVMMGKSCYFQYKQLLAKSLTGQAIEIDELQTEDILKIMEQEKPSVIFFDSLCNAKGIPVPNLVTIINYLIKHSKKDTYLVLDNTGLSVAFQPFKLIVGKTRKVHLILFESLMKYVHLGLDRVTGGIITAYGKDTQKIFEYRKNLGTNILDSSVYAFPKPDRKILEGRLKRYERNALLLATFLQEYIDRQKNILIEKIIYPGLPNYSGYKWTTSLSFHGSFFNLEFKKKNIRVYKRFIDVVIKEAKKQNVDIVAGTSFGLNTTRVYLTSLWTDFGEPFVRVSVGTENRLQIEELKKVFTAAIDKMSRFPLVIF